MQSETVYLIHNDHTFNNIYTCMHSRQIVHFNHDFWGKKRFVHIVCASNPLHPQLVCDGFDKTTQQLHTLVILEQQQLWTKCKTIKCSWHLCSLLDDQKGSSKTQCWKYHRIFQTWNRTVQLEVLSWALEPEHRWIPNLFDRQIIIIWWMCIKVKSYKRQW